MDTPVLFNGGGDRVDGVLLLPHIAKDQDFSEAIQACNDLLTRKGHDYTQGAEGDRGRLKNFYTSAERMGVSPKVILGVYMNKHLDAVNTFLAKGNVESEPIDTRIFDSINYLLLLFKMVKYERRMAEAAKIPDPPTLLDEPAPEDANESVFKYKKRR